MKKILFLLLLPLLLIPVYAQQDTPIPSWIKFVANAWVNDNLTDAEFREAMKFLIEQGIIPIDNVVTTQETISDEEKRLFQLEIDQKNNEIRILEKELENYGVDNSIMLLKITEQQVRVDSLNDQVKLKSDEFVQYKKDYPIKIGNIGGMLVVDYIQQLEDKIAQLKR